MKPFSYEAPTSVEAAVALLAEHGDKARPMAGGTDLLVQLRQERFDVDVVVDVKRIPELTQLAFDPTAGLTIGAAVPCAVLCESPEVQAYYPGLVDGASIIGGAAIQGRATLGGNLCNASPSGDGISALIALGAEAIVTGPQSTRTVPVADFCTAPGKSVLDNGELLVSLHLPTPQSHTGAAYTRFTPRHEMDIAVAGTGVWVKLSDDGSTVTDARIVLSAVAPTPLLVEAARVAMIGQSPTEASFAAAAGLAQEAARPIDDVRGGTAQRKHLVGVLVKRALRTAVQRAKEN
ncbi:MAG: xanthine dehydrogenase family protein subunit M [Anaerolineae bacterium]|nr:xanthine dehydrogenase family protein subunit M [Anaerolineae bacterium]